jgi:hypothetical protein
MQAAVLQQASCGAGSNVLKVIYLGLMEGWRWLASGAWGTVVQQGCCKRGSNVLKAVWWRGKLLSLCNGSAGWVVWGICGEKFVNWQ